MATKKTSSSSEKQGLEQGLQRLEEIVAKLEQKDQSLEKSIAHFEEGVEIYKKCRESLAQAEKRISVLTEDLKEEDLSE